jgi:catechol 2,3-dioxygenase-like lactoylglutathione lyase family enzyme
VLTALRPPIVGIAHFAVKTSDLSAARAFYGHDLGFAELFSIDNPAGGLLLTLFKWQLNPCDPNFTRVELMEPKPVQTPCCSPMK